MVVAARDTLTKIKKNRKREIQQQLGRCSKRSAVQNALSYRACGGCCHNHLRYSTAYASIHLFGCYIQPWPNTRYYFPCFWGRDENARGKGNYFGRTTTKAHPDIALRFVTLSFCFLGRWHAHLLYLRERLWAPRVDASSFFFCYLVGTRSSRIPFFISSKIWLLRLFSFFFHDNRVVRTIVFSSPPIYHFNIDYKTAVGSFLFLRRF